MSELRTGIIKLRRVADRIRDSRTGCNGSSGPGIRARGNVVAPEVAVFIVSRVAPYDVRRAMVVKFQRTERRVQALPWADQA